MSGRLGVGFIGAGPVTQAIHLPALAQAADLFRVVAVMDPEDEVARKVAARVEARPTTSMDDLLDDPAVDVVAVCSPHRFHAQQTIAACRAGKKAVLCEKPFALSVVEAESVARTAEATGVPVVVGTMHSFDSAWKWAKEKWGELPGSVHSLRSSIVLPPNSRFEDFATEVVGRSAPTPADMTDPEVRARVVRAGLIGVGMHNIPHLRAFLPPGEPVTVLDAQALRPPLGYHVVAAAGPCLLDLQCLLYDTWRPAWVFEAVAHTRALRIEFTPSYVQAGSAAASISTMRGTIHNRPAPANGYVEEWGDLAALARRQVVPPDVSALVADLRLALALADATADFVRGEVTA